MVGRYMKQVINRGGRIIVEEVPAPIVKKGYVLVQNICSLISPGTESTSLEQSSGGVITKAMKKPELIKDAINKIKSDGLKSTFKAIKQESEKFNILGYSSAGIVIDKGENVNEIEINDRVACAGLAYHSEIVSIPKNLVVKIPDNVTFEEAAITTLGSIAIQSVRRAKVQIGDIVVVIGLGLVGQLTVQILNASGCRIIGIDLNETRVKYAEKFGIQKGLNPNEEDIVKSVLDYTEGIGADVAIICAATKSNVPVNQAMEMLRKKGTLVVVGDVGLSLKRSQLYKKELDFLISTSYGPGRYDPQYEETGIDYPIGYVRWTENRNMRELLRLITEKRIDVKSLITHTFPMEKAEKAYSIIKNSEIESMGIILKYKKINEEKKDSKLYLTKSEKKIGKINVAVIGSGSFAKAFHLPNLRDIPDYNIKAIVSASGTNAKQIAEQYHAEYCTTDFMEVLKDKDIDMVLIATRHDLHAKIALSAAKAGKAIFLEKPMALNTKEMNELVSVLKKVRVPFTVGFNRRFSPCSVRAKELISKRINPIMVEYRVNAGYTPPDHWIHTKEGGGRIIGEACHMFDLFNYFTDSNVDNIKASFLSPKTSNISPKDNFVSTLKYDDGSVCNLTYASIGSKELGKEYIEIYSDGKVIINNNFSSLTVYGIKEKELKLKNPQKGHKEELLSFAKCVKGESRLPIPIEQLVRTTELSFQVDKMVGKKS